MTNWIYHVDGSIHKRTAWFRVDIKSTKDDPLPMYVLSLVHDTNNTKEYEEYTTNNEFEYLAVMDCILDHIDKWKPRDNVTIQTDSRLIVKHLNGEWKIKYDHLRKLCGKVLELKAGLLGTQIMVNFEWIPRERNLAGHILEDLVKQDYKIARKKKVRLTVQSINDLRTHLTEDGGGIDVIPSLDNTKKFVEHLFKNNLHEEVIWT